MKKNIITGGVILLVVLAGFLGYTYMGKQGAVDGPRLVDSTQPLTSGGEIDTSDWKVYENDDLGVSFRYPKSVNAPEVARTKKDQSVFKGDVMTIHFEGVNMNAVIFGDDSTIAAIEGSPGIFNPSVDMSLSKDQIKQALNKKDTSGGYPYGYFVVNSLDKIQINNKKGVDVIHDTGFIEKNLVRSLLFPNFFKAVDGRNHIIVNLSIDGDTDKNYLESDFASENLVKFLSTVKRD